MTQKAARVINSILISILSLGISFISIKSTTLLGQNPIPHKELVASYLYLFNLPLLLSWFILGTFAGVFISLITLFTTLIVAVGSQIQEYYLYIILFACVDLVGYIYVRQFETSKNILRLDLEELEEDQNMLQEELSKRKVLADSYDKKLVDLTKLKSVTENLSMSLGLDDIANTMVNSTRELISNADRCLLYLIDTKKEGLYLVVSVKSQESHKVETKKGDIFDMWVLKHRQPLLVTDADSDFRFTLQKEGVQKKHFESLIICPLMSEGKVLGILRLDSARKNLFTTYELSLLDKVASLSALAVHNSLLFQEQEELAIRDGLTGLYLQRYFKERLKGEFQRSLRKNSPMSLLMIDIDDFKQYNDKHGHQTGDEILKKLASFLVEAVRATDMVFRYGGEEFAIMLPQTLKQGAIEVAKRTINLERQNVSITISIGLASYPEDAADKDDLIAKSDAALYQAKQLGKDRICLWGE